MPSTLFRNASVMTMDPRRPRATAVLVRGDRIAWVGRDEDAPSLSADRAISCGGATLLPGLIDAHIHLLAYASSLSHLDCSRHAVASIRDIQSLLRATAHSTPPGQWLRASGYDEFYLKEHRHPTRADLDAAPGHPVRLDHRSGHACVLNSLGLELVGIGPDTPDPPEGVIQRDQEGRPTGLLLEMGGYLSQRMREAHDQERLAELLAEASQALLRWGVTSVQDASPENDPERWHALRAMQEKGVLRQRLTFMPGIHRLSQFTDAGLARATGDDWLRLGPAKLMVTLTTGILYPIEEEILALVQDAHRNGFPVAAHAVEEEAIVAVLRAFTSQTQDLRPGFVARDRIEHCSEATPEVQMLLKAAKATVVAQPGFLYESGERYAATVPREMQPWLYPLRALRDLGLPMAAGSDAPVASPNPWWGLYSAVTRRSTDGMALRPEQRLPLEDALRLYTAGASSASGEGGLKGTIQAGTLADLVLLDRDILRGGPEALLTAQAAVTMVGGTVAWEV